MMSLTQLW